MTAEAQKIVLIIDDEPRSVNPDGPDALTRAFDAVGIPVHRVGTTAELQAYIEANGVRGVGLIALDGSFPPEAGGRPSSEEWPKALDIICGQNDLPPDVAVVPISSGRSAYVHIAEGVQYWGLQAFVPVGDELEVMQGDKISMLAWAAQALVTIQQNPGLAGLAPT
jgi:hypothetical protein